MTSFGNYPLVYQLQNGVPVGLAESSSFSAINLVVSSISATDYLNLNITGSFSITGVVQIGDATSVGASLVDNNNTSYPLIRPLAANVNDFVGFSVAGDNSVTIGWGANPLPIAHGGTNATDVAGAQIALSLVPGSDVQAQNPNLQELAELSIGNKQILVGGPTGGLELITPPTTDNTFLKYNSAGAGSFSWDAGGGSNSFPNEPGRIPYIINTTTLGTQPWLNIETGTGRFNVCEVYAVGPIYEGGTSLVNKYQACDVVLESIASLNPVADQLIYFNGTNTATTATLTNQGRQLLDDTSFASMRTTLELGNIATRNITSPPAGGLYFENDPTGTINTNSNLTFTTNTLKSPAVCATTVCAATFNEGGTTLASKYLTQANAAITYQPCDVFLDTLANQTYVDLGGVAQVYGTLPIANGGTSKSSFTNNGAVVFFDNTLAGSFSENSNFTFLSNVLKSPTVCGTTVCGAYLFENGVNITSKYETQTNAANTYTTKSTYNTFTGTLALSAGLKDVLISTLSNGQVLKWNGSNWINDTDATGTGGSTSPVGPEGAVQYRSGGVSFTGVDSFIFNQTSSLLTTNSVSSGIFYAAGTGKIKTPKSNYVYYGSPDATTFGGITYPKGFVTQDQNGEFWFSSNSVIAGATQPGPSATLFVRRVCVGGAQATTNNIGVVFGRFVTNPGIGPGLDPIDLDPPEFLTLTGAGNYLTYMDSNGTLSYASAMSVYKKNGSLSSSPDTLQINGILIAENLSSTLDATIDNDLIVLGNAQILGTLDVGTVSATTYVNLPSSTITWLNATNAERVRKYVKNMTGSTIPKGRAVTITGATGDNSLIAPLSSVNTHVPEAIGFSNHVFGLTETEIAHDSFGYIITEGMVSGTGGGVNAIDTSLFTAGDILYVSSNGLLSNTRPTPPYESHPIGYVVRSHANVGSIYVKVETVPEINDIVGFNLASSLVNGDLITYDLTTSTFVNRQSIDLSGLIKGGSLSATNLSATNSRITSLSATTVSATTYRNLPQTDASSIAGTTVNIATFPIDNYSILTWSTGNNAWEPGTTARLFSVSSTNLSSTNATFTTIRGTSVSSTTVSATTYLNLPTSSLSGLSDVLITSPATSSVLKWNGTKWVPATDQTGAGSTPAAGTVAGAIQFNDGVNAFTANDEFYYDAKNLYIHQGAAGQLNTDTVVTTDIQALQMSIDTVSLTSPAAGALLVNSSLRSPTVSATTYLNLPSGIATWNANQLQSVAVTSTSPVATQHLEYDGVSWKPEWNSVSTINSTVTLTNTCDEKLFVSSSGSKVTVTLPDPTTCAGKEIQLIKTDPSGMPVYVSAATLQSPGNLITMRIPRDMVQVISDGTNWYIQHNNSSYGGSHETGTYDVEFEDFIWGSTETGEVGIRNWSFTNGTVAIVNNTGVDGTGRGIINRQSGTTANQVASMYPMNAGTNTPNYANEILDFKIRQVPTTITAYKIRFGMFNDMTADPPASGIYYECSSGQSNYQAITRNNAVETKTDCGVAVGTASFSTFRIFRRSDSAIEFYIDDNIVAVNTANIPSQHAITFGYQCIPTTTTAKGSNIDYIAVAVVDTTQRY